MHSRKLLWAAFAIAVISYCITRTTSFGLIVKPIPILILAAIVWTLPSRLTKHLILTGLSISMVGDVILEIGYITAAVALFSLVMLLYALTFTLDNLKCHSKIAFAFLAFGFGLYLLLYSYLGDQRISGAIYQLIIMIMLWRAAALIATSPWKMRNTIWAFGGAMGIALNGILYAVDLYLFPVHRDLVITVYYLGQMAIVVYLLQIQITIEKQQQLMPIRKEHQTYA